MNKTNIDQKKDVALQQMNSEQISTSANEILIEGTLPALLEGLKIGAEARLKKFDWNDPAEVIEKIREEILELEVELTHPKRNRSDTECELGDILFSVCQLARHLDLDPEQCLRKSNRKFLERFNLMQKICSSADMPWDTLSPEEKHALWIKAKFILQSSTETR